MGQVLESVFKVKPVYSPPPAPSIRSDCRATVLCRTRLSQGLPNILVRFFVPLPTSLFLRQWLIFSNLLSSTYPHPRDKEASLEHDRKKKTVYWEQVF